MKLFSYAILACRGRDENVQTLSMACGAVLADDEATAKLMAAKASGAAGFGEIVMVKVAEVPAEMLEAI